MLSTSDWNKSVKAAERLLQAKSSRTQLRLDAASPRSWYDLRRRVDKGKITVACFLCLEALARSYSQACLRRAKGLGASVHSPRICMQPAPAWQLEHACSTANARSSGKRDVHMFQCSKELDENTNHRCLHQGTRIADGRKGEPSRKQSETLQRGKGMSSAKGKIRI